jgi:hypothetical protein
VSALSLSTPIFVITMRLISLISTLGLALVLGLVPPAVHADAGHDHGEAPTTAAGPAMPRFAATSEVFELVGVLDGQKLALYLDHAGDNSPVKDARLELDIAGTRVPVTRVADGEFQAALAAPLAEGVSPITATVVAGADTDLLAGEIDIHAAAHAHAEPTGRRNALVAGAVAAVLAALAVVWGLRRGRAARAQRLGGAA